MEILVLGADLPQGEAKRLFERSSEFKTTLPEESQALIPDAVCFGVTELQDYLGKVQDMFDERGIPAEQRGIALMPGKHNGLVEKEHLSYKVTTVFVASKVESHDKGQEYFIRQLCDE